MFRGGVLLAVGLFLAVPAGYAEQFVDPMQPDHGTRQKSERSKRPARPRLWLSSIVIADGRKLAVINGRTVGEGQRISGARVLTIRATEVDVRWAGGTMTLDLVPLNIKKPARDTQ